jgi:glucose/arabinose dehydrogenase
MPVRTLLCVAVAALLSALAAGCGEGDDAPAGAAAAAGPVLLDDAPTGRGFDVEQVAGGFVRPTFVSAAPGDDRGLWVLEQTGSLLRVADGRRTRVLDLREAVSVDAERGLLGLAFHPDFATSRRLVVNYTDARGDTRVVQYTLDRRLRARPDSRRELLRVVQPEENHNGGGLQFGPDGRLYVGMGDGGGAFDPRDAAQDPGSRLGKLLAADVDDASRTPEWTTVLSGLRNPWRFWMDPAMNEVWLGDVGQDAVEELDRVTLEPDEPPKNLGWPAYEGVRRFEDRRTRGDGELVAPVATYTHDQGCSVTGGLIYRGTALPDMGERYVLGDFCTGALWTLRAAPRGAVRDARREAARVPQLTHIGTDPRGELVFATGDGRVLRAVPPRAG